MRLGIGAENGDKMEPRCGMMYVVRCQNMIVEYEHPFTVTWRSVIG